MNDQKIINAMTACMEGAYSGACVCGECPWDTCDTKHETAVLPLDLAEAVLFLLKAQRPRVMTLEEVKRLLPGADVWIEYHDLTGWKIAAITVREIFDNGLLGELQSLRYSFDRYGRYNGDWLAWRCWTARPTDEQREATQWN